MSQAICQAKCCKHVSKAGGEQVGANRKAQNPDKAIFKASGGASSEHLLLVGEIRGGITDRLLT